MSKIAILYICTGEYSVFWQPFFESFEKYFLLNSEKHYYVFTDSKQISYNSCNRVHIQCLAPMPWPIITLMRFHTFLTIESELSQYEYLVFSNSNMECKETITEAEFLPRIEMGERLFVTAHPGYFDKKTRYAPFERRKYSTAYIPYNCGIHYVIGAMNGGVASAFLEMAHVVQNNINEDLKKNTIARWHDESHLNKYIFGRTDCRVLSPAYCYPFGFDVPYPCKIAGVSKADKFDVAHFKGNYKTGEKRSLFKRIINRIYTRSIPTICYWHDFLLHRNRD